MNYTNLVLTIKAYAENEFPQTVGSFTSKEQIDTFIQQAEQRVYNSVQFPAIKKSATGTVTIGSPYVAAPTDFLAVYSLAAIDPTSGEYDYLLNKDVNFVREAYPSPTSTGKPRYYAIFGPEVSGAPPAPTAELRFILGPTPDKAYNTELHYYYYPESIVTAGTTWLGDNFDSVLLYGALLEAAAFMKSDVDTMASYQKRYDEALGLAKRLGDGLDRQDAYRNGQARYPVR